MKITHSDKIIAIKIMHEFGKNPQLHITVPVDFSEQVLIYDDVRYKLISQKQKVSEVECIYEPEQLLKFSPFPGLINYNFPWFTLDETIILPEKLGEQFDFSHILSIKYKKNHYGKTNLVYEFQWNHLRIAKTNLNQSIVSKDYEKLRAKLPSIGWRNNLHIDNIELTLDKTKYIYADKVYAASHCSLLCSASAVINIKRIEKICIKYRKNDGKEKTSRHVFHLPANKPYENWSPNYYNHDEIVCYEGKLYTCITPHYSTEFQNQNWRVVCNEQVVSFLHEFSFCETEQGKRFIELIEKTFMYTVEQQLGDHVQISLIAKEKPKLNDYFVHLGKVFRIVKFDCTYNGQYYINLHGIEILPFEKSNIGEWTHDANEKLVATVRESKFDEISFEGLVFYLPEDNCICKSELIMEII